ncbi:MAG: aminotransferase class IV [Saprospiraceae bacterium]|nr:aminotransferase class IV [Saprospiraceae bacterium]
MIQFYNVNGELVNAVEASLKVTDLATLRGYGVFDFFLVRSGVPMYVDDYVARFERSAGHLNLDLPISKEALKEQIQALIQVNKLDDAAIQLVLTGGYAEDGYTPVQPNLLMLGRPMLIYNNDVLTKGVKVLLHQHQRELPEAKTINYLTGIRLAGNMKQQGAVEILYHDGQFVREGVRSNFFIITKDNIIITPKDKLLHGITRKNTIALAQQHFTLEERDVTPQELLAAKEVFITSTTKGAMPVVQIDHHIIGDGKPGEVTLLLGKLLHEHDIHYIESRKVMA